MKGFITRSALGLGLGLGLASLTGCTHYRELVDPCWPERYNAMARASVNQANNAQAFNGHVLDHTLWNYHFEHDAKGAPTDRLNAAGIDHLKYIARRRPAPSGRVFLQTANDMGYRADVEPEVHAQQRSDIDSKRIMSVQKFLASHTAGHASFVVEVHDPNEVGIAAQPIIGNAPALIVGAYPGYARGFVGVLPVSTSGGTSGGSSGGGSAGGGNSGR